MSIFPAVFPGLGAGIIMRGCLLAVILLPAVAGIANAADINDCLMHALEAADDSNTVGELRLQCHKEVTAGESAAESSEKVELSEQGELAVVEERLHQESRNILQPFNLMAHKPNYILPFAYSNSGYHPSAYQQEGEAAPAFDHAEVQFQFSVKMPLLVDLFERKIDIYAAYTNHSFWQLYEDSSPFRETNHEPEVWLQYPAGWKVLGFSNTLNAFGLVHQSNGRDGNLSRSWNRLFASFVLERGNLAFNFRPWYRLPEDYDEDDNPDITNYLGHFELHTVYKWQDHVLSLMTRNNLESGFEKGAVELTWSFPVWKYPFVKGYLQCFSGYGESLINYDNYLNKIAIGLALTDWL